VGGIDSRGHGYVLEDASVQASPAAWGSRVVDVYQQWQADRVAGEKNYGGDMVENTIRTCAQEAGVIVSYKDVHASRGKAIRAEPIAALYEQGRIHHVGELAALEEEMCTWLPNRPGRSPNRMDALVWVFTELITRRGRSGGPGIR
jgi:phage terminase large subunit-like protein